MRVFCAACRVDLQGGEGDRTAFDHMSQAHPGLWCEIDGDTASGLILRPAGARL